MRQVEASHGFRFSSSVAMTTNRPFYAEYYSDAVEQRIAQPFVHIARIPGKKVRSKLSEGINRWMKISEDKLKQVEVVLETLHNASLLLDDIQDESILRRGVPAAHSIYGTLRTVNSSNYVAFRTFKNVLDLGHPEAIRIVISRCVELYKGQGMEIYWRDNFTCPSLEEYRLMCIRKTGGLFLLGIELMQLFSELKADFTTLGEAVGLFFQVRDDYMNLTSDEYTATKSFCDDISEGKFSFPIIHAIQSHPEDKRVINILRSKPRDVETKKQCLALLKKFGSLEFTKVELERLKTEVLDEMEKLPENPVVMQILNQLLKFD